MSEPSRPSARPQHNQGAAYKRPVPRRPAALGDQAASCTPAAHDRTHALAHVCTYTCNDLHTCAYMLRSTHTSCTARPTPVTSIRTTSVMTLVLCSAGRAPRDGGGGEPWSLVAEQSLPAGGCLSSAPPSASAWVSVHCADSVQPVALAGVHCVTARSWQPCQEAGTTLKPPVCRNPSQQHRAWAPAFSTVPAR